MGKWFNYPKNTPKISFQDFFPSDPISTDPLLQGVLDILLFRFPYARARRRSAPSPAVRPGSYAHSYTVTRWMHRCWRLWRQHTTGGPSLRGWCLGMWDEIALKCFEDVYYLLYKTNVFFGWGGKERKALKDARRVTTMQWRRSWRASWLFLSVLPFSHEDETISCFRIWLDRIHLADMSFNIDASFRFPKPRLVMDVVRSFWTACRVQQWLQALDLLQNVPKRDQQLEGSQQTPVGIGGCFIDGAFNQGGTCERLVKKCYDMLWLYWLHILLIEILLV